MKAKLFITFLLFVLAGFVSSQQCNIGICTNFVNQYPSGTFTTTSSTWSLVNGGNNMNAGNYTDFSVTLGNTYEWSYCESFGGVSTAWDAQLVLFNKTELTKAICFSTDDCGTNGNAPYLSWTATFTGTVRVLTSAYINKTGCQSNTGSPYNKLVWRRSASAATGYNLTVTVNNVDGSTTMSGATVKLYNSDYSIVIATKTANSSGQVIFSGLANNTYNYEVYYTPTGKNPPITNEEYWGSKAVTISGSAKSDSFTRIQPYISDAPSFNPSTLTTGQQSIGTFKVKNALTYSCDSYISVWVDRDKVSTWDYTSNSSSTAKTINAGSTSSYTFNITQTNAGTYYFYAFVYTKINGNYIITDQYSWVQAYTLTAPIPLGSHIDFQPIALSKLVTINDILTFKGTLKDVNGNNIPNFKIGIDDGLRLQCMDGVITNQNGEFSYSTSAKQSGLAEILFYLPNGEKHGIYINVADFSTEYSTTIAGVKQINIVNESLKDWIVKIIVDNIEKNIIIKSGAKVIALASESMKNHFPFKITTSASLKLKGINIGVAGISISENNEGTIKIAANAGEAIYRGKLYFTYKGDYGGCWAPGVDTGLLAKLEGTVCLGTDGISTGAGVSLGNVGASFSIKLYEFTSGINNTNLNSIIKIHPNPSNGKLEISEIEALGNKFKVSVIDLQGKIIYTSVYNNFENKISLDLSTYPKGFYLIKLSNNEVSFQNKVIIY